MKKLILGLTCFMSMCTFACEQLEAQFIGVAKNVENCSYQIEFKYFTSSAVCPLDIDEALNARLRSVDCQVKNGDEVSGVLVLKDNILVID